MAFDHLLLNRIRWPSREDSTFIEWDRAGQSAGIPASLHRALPKLSPTCRRVMSFVNHALIGAEFVRAQYDYLPGGLYVLRGIYVRPENKLHQVIRVSLVLSDLESEWRAVHFVSESVTLSSAGEQSPGEAVEVTPKDLIAAENKGLRRWIQLVSWIRNLKYLQRRSFALETEFSGYVYHDRNAVRIVPQRDHAEMAKMKGGTLVPFRTFAEYLSAFNYRLGQPMPED